MSASNTKRVRADQPPRGKTDWDRLRNMTEEEIEAAAASDPDNPPADEEFWRDARTIYPDSPRYEVIGLHIDVDLLKWFMSRRRLYQDEINEALRAYMEAHRDED